MKSNRTAGSLKLIFHGFRRISKSEQSEYLKYLELVIERNPKDKSLAKFKTKLEKEIETEREAQ